MVWCTKKNQNTFVFWFFFLSARWKGLEQGGGAQRRKQSHLACGSQHVGMSTVEAVKSKDFMAFLFCKP